MAYNPFDKPVESLAAKDLNSLIKNKVAEGYHVEYKSDFPKNEKVGKSIASFANTYGGWYIVGVKTDEHNIAEEICGFDSNKYNDPISKIREIAKSHIDPVPVLHTRIIKLKSNRAVLIVNIPGNQETPFVSKDGRIYRRTQDSSEPISETDRHAIDKLFERSQKIGDQFKRFCKDERTFSKAEENVSWVTICLSPYPLGTFFKNVSSIKEIENILELSKKQIQIPFSEKFGEISGNIPFDSAQTTFESVILRQGNISNLFLNSATVEFFEDGRAKFHIPLVYFNEILSEIDFSESAKTKELLEKINSFENNVYLRFFDIGKLWMTMAVLISFYEKWLGEESKIVDLQLGIIFDGIWRAVPFSESDEWAENVEKFGLPIKNKNNAMIPENIERGLLCNYYDMLLWLWLGYNISLELGMPRELYSHTLHNAFIKAIKESSQSIT